MEKLRNIWKKEYGVGIAGFLVMLVAWGFTMQWVSKYSTGWDAFRKVTTVLGILLFITVCVAFVCLKIKKVALEYVFVLVTLVFSIGYNLMIPVYAVPDEEYHLSVAYAVAGNLMGWSTEDIDTEILRTVEAETTLQGSGIAHDYYNSYFSSLKERVSDGETVEVSYSYNTEVPHILYLPAAVGIALGRVLHLGVAATVTLGRFFNMLVYLVAGFLALRLLPMRKELLLLIMTFPETLQEVNGISSDSPIFSMAFLATALLINLAYKEKDVEIKEKKTIGKLVMLFLLLFLLAKCKYGACVPFAALVLLLVFRKKGTKLSKASLGIGGAAVVLGFIPSLAKAFTGNYLVNSANPYYTVSYVLTHPYEMFLLLGNTWNRYFDNYFAQMFGSSLGWYEFHIPLYLIYGLFVILVLYLMLGMEDSMVPSRKEKICIGLVAVCGMGFAVAGMLIGNTPAGTDYVVGVQGRYFLPYLFLFFLLFTPKVFRVENREETGKTLTFAAFILYFLMFLTLFLRAY